MQRRCSKRLRGTLWDINSPSLFSGTIGQKSKTGKKILNLTFWQNQNHTQKSKHQSDLDLKKSARLLYHLGFILISLVDYLDVRSNFFLVKKSCSKDHRVLTKQESEFLQKILTISPLVLQNCFVPYIKK